MDGVAERPPFGNRERRRLLEVDVLAGLDGVDGDDRVLVIGRADDDGVDVAVGQQLAIVAVSRHAVVGLAGLLARTDR